MQDLATRRSAARPLGFSQRVSPDVPARPPHCSRCRGSSGWCPGRRSPGPAPTSTSSASSSAAALRARRLMAPRRPRARPALASQAPGSGTFPGAGPQAGRRAGGDLGPSGLTALRPAPRPRLERAGARARGHLKCGWGRSAAGLGPADGPPGPASGTGAARGCPPAREAVLSPLNKPRDSFFKGAKSPRGSAGRRLSLNHCSSLHLAPPSASRFPLRPPSPANRGAVRPTHK